ncbi:MAG TPA: hypothetical protein VM869_03940 [Enhygromyxa sp.]|nr:hypothetical protein [Enhygromyxa sp.]
MRDVDIWEQLQPPIGDALLPDEAPPMPSTEQLLVALMELARAPFRQRAPLLGPAAAWREHADPRVRAAVIAVLSGVTGIEGLRALVSALDDDAAEVRQAAVRSLCESALSGQELRLAHALFHPRDDVRQQAVAQAVAHLPSSLEWLASYLRCDPICAETVGQLPLRAGLRLALDLHARELASDAELCEVLATCEDFELIELLRYAARRSKEQLADARRWLDDGGPAPGGADLLDRLLAAIDRSGNAQAIPPLVRNSRHADCGARLVVSAVLRLAERGELGDPLLTLAVRQDPTILASEVIPLPQRQRAARLYAKRDPRSHTDSALASTLLDSPLILRPDGALDLRVAASIAWLLPGPRHARLLAQLGIERVLARLEAGDIDGFVGLCDLPPATPELVRQHPELRVHSALELLAMLPAAQRPRLRAAAIATWTSTFARSKALIESLSESELCECVPPLLHEIDGEHVVIGDKTRPRLAEALTEPLGEIARLEVARALLDDPRLRPLKAAVLERLLREASQPKLALFVTATPVELLLRLIAWLQDGVHLPFTVEVTLAELLRAHASTKTRAAAEKLARPGVVVVDRPLSADVHELSKGEADTIASCALNKLGNALAPALAAPCKGLTAALARRAQHGPSLEVCVALIGAQDPLQEVASGFVDYFDHDDPSFAQTLLAAAVTMWQRNPNLTPLGNAWLHNFEQHAFAFGKWLLVHLGGLLGALEICASFALPALRVRCFEAAAYVFALWRYREPDRMRSFALDGVPTKLVEQLDTELGPPAAKLLVTLFLAGVCARELDSLKQRVLLLAPDLDRVTRHELHRWLRIDGLPDRDVAARAQGTAVRGDLLAQLRTTDDLDLLAEACMSPSLAIVDEAVLRLLELGEPGEQRLVLALAEAKPPPRFDVLVASVAMWSSPQCVDDVRALAADPEVEVELRFRMALALTERGEREQVEVAIAALREHQRTGWFRADDWDKLARSASVGALAFALVDSPHPHAYQRAVEWLLEQPPGDRTVLPPLRVFLRCGTHRPTHYRRRVAERLLACKDPIAAPVMLASLVDDGLFAWVPMLEPSVRARVIEAVVSAALIGGQQACTQRRASILFDVAGIGDGSALSREAVDRALRRLFLECTDDAVRSHLAQRTSSPQWRRSKLQGIAQIFAWGVRRGRELTGRLFRVHMTDKRQDFGYTLLDEDRIFVTPLPYFAGDRHGREIVEALILHEFGHHMYHRGEQAAEIWRRAQKRGLHNVLNLVADEHLERNLRSLRADYGDRLKRLAAHAFLHAERDLGWDWLLEQLGASSFSILSSKPTAPAHDPKQLRVQRGDLLQALEANGSSWARFARALRMGLGDRWDDPRVQAGLDLFKGRFRHADMAELWRITEALAQLFAGELPLANVCGGHETLGDCEREGAVARGAVSDDAVQEEVERILDPRQLQAGEGRSRVSGKLAINVGEDERFDLITDVRRVPRKPDAHRKVAREVTRHAARLRAYLCELGLDLVPRHARLRGRTFDRSRTQAVVVRRDPRMLIARELEVHNDLFIGVLIDCSGSMSVRDLLAKACHFAVLIAEAVRSLPGVEARFWGFTDSVIWDAGDAERCAVTSLESSGGNNDAAALLHAAQVAAAARRRAKLLVMISDGLPTQCSVAALRNLVVQLGRRQQIVCAQVAVRPLEEICFPHYVLLSEEPLELATVRFGELVSKLARRALGR